MGANEDELARIAAAGPFTVPELGALRNSLAALGETMKNIAGSPGWEGLSAHAASDHLEQLSRSYYAIERRIGEIQDHVDEANRVRSAALADFGALPSAKAPDWVHDTLDAFDFPGIPQPVDLAQGGLALIEDFLGGQRDAAAGRILAAYADALVAPGNGTVDVVRNIIDDAEGITGKPIPMPDPGPSDDPPGYTPPGGYGPSGHTPPGYTPPGYTPPDGYTPPGTPEGPRYPTPEIGVDDPTIGVLPDRPDFTTGGPGPVPTGPGSGGSGLPAGAGIGAGAALAGAAALRAGGAVGGLSAAARLGTGGLLGGAGMGAPGMNGAAGANAARAGGGTGVRGAGGGMMGAGANAGGSREERKRGRGLGGPIAPKLDDEDPTVLPGAGARAGGREATASSDDD